MESNIIIREKYHISYYRSAPLANRIENFKTFICQTEPNDLLVQTEQNQTTYMQFGLVLNMILLVFFF